MRRHLRSRSRRRQGPDLLQAVWHTRAIPFEQEAERLIARLQTGVTAANYWTEIAEATLAGHLQSSLRKMRAGNPDSRLLDFDDGRWLIPNKARTLTHPYPSRGLDRLDQAHSWLRQMALLTDSDGQWRLATLAEGLCAEWDKVHCR